jgi:F-type H+-transporting ATPase subunit b
LKTCTAERITGIGLTVLFVWGLVPGDALANNGFQFTRIHYDQIMRYVNFIILALVLLKFGRKPLVNFLRGQKTEVADSINRLETRKHQAEQRIAQCRRQLTHSQERLARISERIQAEGFQLKQKLIEQAQQESKMMMAAAQMKIQGYLRDAAEGLKAEILDAAVQKSINKLPSVMVGEDHDRLFNQWLEEVEHKLA